MRLLVFLVGAMLLTGCVSSGVRVEEASLTSLEKGKTSFSEVIGRLEQPTTNTLLPDGRRMLIYSWMQARARPQSFIPLVGPFVGGADSRSSSVIIWIGADGRLENY